MWIKSTEQEDKIRVFQEHLDNLESNEALSAMISNQKALSLIK
jgi:hypothetical protein